MSFLTALKGDVVKVFNWIGSPKGQAVISLTETGVEAAFPAADGVITLLNTWGTEIFKSEALAMAAGATGSNTQKAASVLNVLTPEVIAFAKAQGTPIPDAAKIQAINDGLVKIFNILAGTDTTPAQGSTAA